MSKTIDKLIDDILELILEDMDCHHEVDQDEYGVHTSVEYSLNDEVKLRGKIKALLKPEVTEEFVEKWADKFEGFIYQNPGLIIDIDLLKQMLKEAGVGVKK